MAVDKRGRKLPRGIRLRGKGYEGRFYYEGKEYAVHGRTVTETQEMLTDLQYQVRHGLYIKKENLLFGEWFDTWMKEYKKNQVKVGTYVSYQKFYDSMIKRYLGGIKLSSIRGEHIQRIYNGWVEEGYAISSIKIASAVLNGCFKQAEKNGLIERNPVKRAMLPREKERSKRQAMNKEQQELFMEYAKDSYLYYFFAVMLRTGLRSGEMRGLKYTDIKTIPQKNRANKQKGECKVLQVRRTLKYIEGQGYMEDTPKTRTSIRDIPLTEDTLKLLEKQHKFWGFTIERIDRYLFCNENGEPLSRERVQGEIDRITKKIRADGYEFPRITSHVFRHTFATRAIEAGMQPQVLKTILGHSTLAMTMDLYSHVLPDVKAEEMQKIAQIF